MPWTTFDDDLLDGGAVPEKKDDSYLRDRFSKARNEIKPRTPWERFKDSLYYSTLHSPWGGESVVRHGMTALGYDQKEIDRRELSAFHDEEIKYARDEEAFKDADTLSPANIGKHTADLVGGLIGGVDPTYVLGPGKTPIARILAQMGINAGMDAASQGVEMGRGTRKEYNLAQTGMNLLGGAVLQGGVEVHGKVMAGKRINAGAKMGNFDDLVNRVLKLEGGGTLDNPKTSPKGAKGPMQVMDATARNPGFGIRPWDGKTEADRARVGRQYLAALNHKYNGDTAKVLAAYNGGPGRVDAALKKYGPEWLRAMPLESRKYVRNGLGHSEPAPHGWEVAGGGPEREADDDFLSLTHLAEQLKEKENDLGPIQDALMRQADEDGFTSQEQPDLGDQVDVNHMLAPQEEAPKLTTEIDDVAAKFGLNSNAAKDLINSGHDLDKIKGAAEYTDTEWFKLPLVVKQASVGLGHKKAEAKVGSTPYFKHETSYAMADKEGIKPGTPEFDKKYGYNKKTNYYDDFDDEAVSDEHYGEEYDPDEEVFDVDFEPEHDAPKPYYDYLGSYDPYTRYANENKESLSPVHKKAIEDVAKELGVHHYDVAEAYLYNESIGAHHAADVSEKVSKRYKQLEWAELNQTKAQEASDEANAYYKPEDSHAPYMASGKSYYNLYEYEKKTGKKVGPLTKQALKDFAELMDLYPESVESHYFSESGHKPIKEGVDSLRDTLAEEQMTPKELAAYKKLPSNDPKVLKVLTPKYMHPSVLEGVLAQRRNASPVQKTVRTFLDMLNDNSGLLAPDPDNLHKAITEWNKGTNHLLKGEDGTPMRLYHGTNVPYEGLPSGEKNRRPKGFVLYSTDPDFANAFAMRNYGGKEADQRVFPVYVKNNGKIADFRNPKDVERAYKWFKERSDSSGSWYHPTKKDLESGNWSYWEEPEMMEANGWDGAFVTESQYDKHGQALNLMIRDKLASSIFDPATYNNNTTAHKIVRVLGNLLKDESGASHFGEPVDLDPTEAKLISALKNATKISAEDRALLRGERAQRAGHVDKLQQEMLGEKGFHAQLNALKGKMPKADYESIRGEFSQEEIDGLLNRINASKSLLPLEKVKAQQAMAKLLGAEGENFAKAPTAGEIKLLNEVFSPRLIKVLSENEGIMKKIWKGTQSAINVPRSIMSSMDVSAPFRQGINFVGKKEFWNAIPTMLKVFASEKNSQALIDSIHSRPTWDLMKKSGLAITDPHSHYLLDREEQFMSDWAEGPIAKKFLVGYGVEASNRAYAGFLNKLRADVFDNMLSKYEKAGINLATDPKKLKEVVRFINAATGRGDMGKHGNAAAPFLAGTFFSPRLMASRLYMLSPHIYAKSDPILRKEAWKALFSYGAMALTVAGLAKYGLGMDVETDPRSSDFMKPKIGNTRYDIMGGYQQYITLAARFLSNSKLTATGKEQAFDPDDKYGETRGGVTAKFLRNKASPIASLGMDWAFGKDAVGNDFNWGSAATQRLSPMGWQDMWDAYKEWGAEGPLLATPSLVGVGVQTYDPAARKEEKDKKKAAKKAAKDELKEYGGSEDFNALEWDF